MSQPTTVSAVQAANQAVASGSFDFNYVVQPVLAGAESGHSFVSLLTIFALACFVGYYVVWRVTPALHSPLMAVTNAVSSVIIVGALLAAGLDGWGAPKILGFLAVVLASVNIFGGFVVTHRMLSMFKKKTPAAKAKK